MIGSLQGHVVSTSLIISCLIVFLIRKREDSSVQASTAVTESLVELRQKLATGLTLSEDTMKVLGELSTTKLTSSFVYCNRETVL